MTELRVERKRPSIWRWIVLLLLLAVVVWLAVELFGGEGSPAIQDDPVGVADGPPASLPVAAAGTSSPPVAARS